MSTGNALEFARYHAARLRVVYPKPRLDNCTLEFDAPQVVTTVCVINLPLDWDEERVTHFKE